jgi:hypothetical protein
MSADHIGAIVDELRAQNIAGKRVRAFEPAGASTSYEGDALGPGHYKRFVVIVDNGGPPVRHIIHRKRFIVRAYGATMQDAAALYGEVQEALHLVGPRIGLPKPLYQSRDNTGGSAAKDPNTAQPYYDGVYVITSWIGPALVGS